MGILSALGGGVEKGLLLVSFLMSFVGIYLLSELHSGNIYIGNEVNIMPKNGVILMIVAIIVIAKCIMAIVRGENALTEVLVALVTLLGYYEFVIFYEVTEMSILIVLAAILVIVLIVSPLITTSQGIWIIVILTIGFVALSMSMLTVSALTTSVARRMLQIWSTMLLFVVLISWFAAAAVKSE